MVRSVGGPNIPKNTGLVNSGPTIPLDTGVLSCGGKTFFGYGQCCHQKKHGVERRYYREHLLLSGYVPVDPEIAECDY